MQIVEIREALRQAIDEACGLDAPVEECIRQAIVSHLEVIHEQYVMYLSSNNHTLLW